MAMDANMKSDIESNSLEVRVYNSQHFVQKLELVNMIEVANLGDKVYYCKLKDDEKEKSYWLDSQ